MSDSYGHHRVVRIGACGVLKFAFVWHCVCHPVFRSIFLQVLVKLQLMAVTFYLFYLWFWLWGLRKTMKTSEKLICGPRFEPGTSQIWNRSATDSAAHSVNSNEMKVIVRDKWLDVAAEQDKAFLFDVV